MPYVISNLFLFQNGSEVNSSSVGVHRQLSHYFHATYVLFKSNGWFLLVVTISPNSMEQRPS
jgi:hypothetical protein